jgi:hypothetical protein
MWKLNRQNHIVAKRYLSAAAILVSLSMFSGCGAIPEKKIYTAIDIEAPIEDVWSILVDNAAYPEWNPYHVKVEGNMRVGAVLDVEINKPNGKTVRIEPHVMRLHPPGELTWGGGIKGLFFGEHVFLLVRLDETKTRLVHKERFSGLAIPFASLDAVEEGYNLMNQALKKRAEALK